jgi:hypothetical protein
VNEDRHASDEWLGVGAARLDAAACRARKKQTCTKDDRAAKNGT